LNKNHYHGEVPTILTPGEGLPKITKRGIQYTLTLARDPASTRAQPRKEVCTLSPQAFADLAPTDSMRLHAAVLTTGPEGRRARAWVNNWGGGSCDFLTSEHFQTATRLYLGLPGPALSDKKLPIRPHVGRNAQNKAPQPLANPTYNVGTSQAFSLAWSRHHDRVTQCLSRLCALVGIDNLVVEGRDILCPVVSDPLARKLGPRHSVKKPRLRTRSLLILLTGAWSALTYALTKICTTSSASPWVLLLQHPPEGTTSVDPGPEEGHVSPY